MAGINKALAGQSAIELWNQILQPPQQPPTEDYISSLQRRKAAGEWLSDAEYADLMGATQQPQPTITPPEEIAPSRAPQPLPETREPWESIGTGRAKEYQAEYDEVKAKAAQYGEGSLSDEERSTLHHGDKISKQPGGYAKYAYDQIMAERERASKRRRRRAVRGEKAEREQETVKISKALEGITDADQAETIVKEMGEKREIDPWLAEALVDEIHKVKRTPEYVEARERERIVEKARGLISEMPETATVEDAQRLADRLEKEGDPHTASVIREAIANIEPTNQPEPTISIPPIDLGGGWMYMVADDGKGYKVSPDG